MNVPTKSPTRGPIIGIDLGTSTSAIAFLTPEGEPELIPDLNGDTIVPSMVQLLPDGQLVVGSVAKSCTMLGTIVSPPRSGISCGSPSGVKKAIADVDVPRSIPMIGPLEAGLGIAFI